MKRLSVLTLVLAGMAALAVGPATTQEKKQPKPFEPPEGVALQRDVEYGTGNSRPLRLHLLLPKAESKTARPVIVWVHGGGWSGGHRDSGLPRLAPLAAQGYVCATIEYRLSSEAKYPASTTNTMAIRTVRIISNSLMGPQCNI